MDARNGVLVFDAGQVVRPRTQWVVAFLYALASRSMGAVGQPGGTRSQEQEAGAVSRVLQGFGLEAELSPKQWQRVVDGLERAFDMAGRQREYAQRFALRPRAKTSGPWAWRVLAGDEIQFEPPLNLDSAWGQLTEAVLPTSPAGFAALPRFAQIDHEHSTVALVHDLLRVDELNWKGFRADALMRLREPSAWEAGAPELQALRCLRAARLEAELRNPEAAERWLMQAVALLPDDGDIVPTLRGLIAVAGLRVVYGRDPDAQYGTVARAMREAAARPSSAPAVDLLPLVERWELMAQCEQRWLEEHGVDHADASRHLEALSRTSHAALFVWLLQQHHQRAQQICARLAYGYQTLALQGRQEQGHARLAMLWHGLSFSFHHSFSLADNSPRDFNDLGALWLDSAAAREALEQGFGTLWGGDRPDEMAFYDRACELARLLNDPRHVLAAELNRYRFAQWGGERDDMDRCLQSFCVACLQHPAEAARLRARGNALPLPARLGDSAAMRLSTMP